MDDLLVRAEPSSGALWLEFLRAWRRPVNFIG